MDRDGLIRRIVLGQQDRCAVGRRRGLGLGLRPPAPRPVIAVAIASYRRESRTGLVSVACTPGPPRVRPALESRITFGPPPPIARATLEAVEAGHVVVEQDEVVRPPLGRAARGSAPGPPAPPVAVSARMRHDASRRSRISRLVALSSTIRTSRPSRSRCRRPRRGCARPAAVTSNQNVLPSPERALDADPPAHQLHQLAADGQAEPGAAVAAGGRAVGLREGLEERLGALVRRCRCRCRAISKRSASPRVVADRASTDLALVRELDRVADQVHQHLAQPPVVAAHGGRARRRRSARRARARARGRARPAGRRRRRRPRAGRSRPGRARACRPRSSRSRGCRR